ncbi:MAG: tRNA epoxyqueuosine(34) reductase QueG [Bacteroidales bacterium]
MKNIQEYSELIKKKALQLGLSACGISRAEVHEEDKSVLEKWLMQGMHADMDWMAKHSDLRKDPDKLFPGARSVVSVLLNYYTQRMQDDPSAPVVSKYAYGRDYHRVLKKKLKDLLGFIQEIIPGTKGRAFVDSAPVLEHSFARNAGLGWIGKHSLLISPEFGSYVFLGELIIDAELDYAEEEVKDLCGNCRLCIDECPTHAIKPGRVVDANRCISYLTIENPGPIPEEFKENMFNRVFGCDICQEVCPWNRKLTEHNVTDFQPDEKMMSMTKEEWKNMDEKSFKGIFSGTPVMRAKFKGLKRNIDYLD